MDHEPMTLEDARALAQTAHRGQEDKLGVEYIQHVEAVAAGLLDFDLDIQIAGMLHDVLEDSHFTLDDLRARGVPERSLAAIEMVSRNLHPDLSYDEAILQISTSLDATLVKISDNAHNSRPDRVAALELVTGKPTNPRYARAREVLYEAAPADQVAKILRRVSPPLFRELPAAAVVVDSLQELFAIFDVADLDGLAGSIGDNLDPDVYPGDDPESAPELIVGRYGFSLEFPTTLAAFWDDVDQAEQWELDRVEATEP
ncbi:HD domain-containing protein [Nocardioides sp.]|uniref:HD domain-containing protein n=1 Tax=Nocardioides sp. TaxID=35761 RepID=UPI0026150E55|nr:HD domain-containing protein [Nocardioides sp.]MDI6910398.1 hypothetical protein [Nocardioides sp.]